MREALMKHLFHMMSLVLWANDSVYCITRARIKRLQITNLSLCERNWAAGKSEIMATWQLCVDRR